MGRYFKRGGRFQDHTRNRVPPRSQPANVNANALTSRTHICRGSVPRRGRYPRQIRTIWNQQMGFQHSPENNQTMGVKYFDEWIGAPLSESINTLKGHAVAVEASWFLQQWCQPYLREPLVPALGGFPLGLKNIILREIRGIQHFGVRLIFVFNGCHAAYHADTDPFAAAVRSSEEVTKAFGIYNSALAQEAIDSFKSSKTLDTRALVSFFKGVLQENKIPYCVAPYDALGQAAYMLKMPNQKCPVIAVCASSEAYLYGITSRIVKFNLEYEKDLNGFPTTRLFEERCVFEYINEVDVLNVLQPSFGSISPEAFRTTLLIAGSNVLDTLPPLREQVRRNPDRKPSFDHLLRHVLEHGGNVDSLLRSWPELPDQTRSEYLEKYMQAAVAVRNPIVTKSKDEVEPMDLMQAPDDIQLCIGLKFPEELNWYLFIGAISPKAMNWLNSGEILIQAPSQGKDSETYRRLVGAQLRSVREQCLALLSSSLHRSFQHKSVTTRFYSPQLQNITVNTRDLTSSKENLATWNVKLAVIRDLTPEGASLDADGPTTLAHVVSLLSNSAALEKTKSKKPAMDDRLGTPLEISCSVLWRFLFLRGYIDKSHQLTPWGKVLAKVYEQAGLDRAAQEAAFINVELVRFGLATGYSLGDNYAYRLETSGKESDTRNIQLLSRLSAAVPIAHRLTGYTGPLSQPALAYQNIVLTLIEHLRDLMETILASMYIENEAQKIDRDIVKISYGLPFAYQPSAGAAVAVKTYFEELLKEELSETPEAGIAILRGRLDEWFVHADLTKTFSDCLSVWDAIKAAILDTSDDLASQSTKAAWKECDEWLSTRRDGMLKNVLVNGN